VSEVYIVGYSTHDGFEPISVCSTADRANVVRGLFAESYIDIKVFTVDEVFDHHLRGERIYRVHMNRDGDYYAEDLGYADEPETTMTVTDGRHKWNGCLHVQRWAVSAEAVASIAESYRTRFLEHDLWPDTGTNETPRIRAFIRYLEAE
jgi:hypothetical protein